MVSIQTFGSYAANFHPHVHALITDGAFTEEGEFLQLPYFDARLDSGFSVHGEQTVSTDDLQGAERLARYLTRGPLPLDVVEKVEGGRLRVRTPPDPHPEPIPSPSRASWARMLKRIFEIDPLLCPACGSAMKIVSVIMEPNVIDAIPSRVARRRRPERAPPGGSVATVPVRCARATGHSRPATLRPGAIGRRTAGPGARNLDGCRIRARLRLDSPG